MSFFRFCLCIWGIADDEIDGDNCSCNWCCLFFCILVYLKTWRSMEKNSINRLLLHMSAFILWHSSSRYSLLCSFAFILFSSDRIFSCEVPIDDDDYGCFWFVYNYYSLNSEISLRSFFIVFKSKRMDCKDLETYHFSSLMGSGWSVGREWRRDWGS